MNRVLLVTAAMLLLLTAACEDFTHAAEPAWNKQPCSHCRMLVSDPRYAAQLVTRSHERLFFDDPGCLAAYMQEHTSEVEQAWVHLDTSWTRVQDARFSAATSSPMGYGLLADRAGDRDFSAVTQAAMNRRAQGSP